MESLIVFIVSFVFVFVTYFIIYLIKYKKGTIKETKEVKFLCYKYGVKIKNMNFKWLWIVFALLNAFIISVSGTVCTSLKIGYVWQVLTGFGFLFIMILFIFMFIPYNKVEAKTLQDLYDELASLKSKKNAADEGKKLSDAWFTKVPHSANSVMSAKTK